jgi:hypothetical protein
VTPGNFLLMLDIVWPPLCALFCRALTRLLRIPPGRLDPLAWPWLCGALGGVFVGACLVQWVLVAACTAHVGIALAIWWWRRRKDRKRAPRAFGYKGRALLAALVASLRESLRPRPVLRPQPGGTS